MFDISWTSLLSILGLALVTVLTRSLFFISDRAWTLPGWAQRGLRYAPVAALAAVVAPEVFMTRGDFITSWQDARLFAAAVGAGWFFWRGGVLGTIVSGMAVYLPLHIGLGW